MIPLLKMLLDVWRVDLSLGLFLKLQMTSRANWREFGAFAKQGEVAKLSMRIADKDVDGEIVRRLV